MSDILNELHILASTCVIKHISPDAAINAIEEILHLRKDAIEDNNRIADLEAGLRESISTIEVMGAKLESMNRIAHNALMQNPDLNSYNNAVIEAQRKVIQKLEKEVADLKSRLQMSRESLDSWMNEE